MPSPFPGMDPYIESLGSWTDFHNDFLVGCREQLNERLPEQYIARIEERLEVLGEHGDHQTVVIPDAVISRIPSSESASRGSSNVATLEPHTLPQEAVWLDEPTETFLQIIRLPEERVVTCVELLSPSNKSGIGRNVYLEKRRELLHHDINLVEIDLLLGGQRLALLAPLPAGDYFAFVSRAEARQNCDVFAWSVRDRLPTIPVPLFRGEPEIPLDLSVAFQRTYERGRYARVLRYQEAPTDLLSNADRVWAAERAGSVRR